MKKGGDRIWPIVGAWAFVIGVFIAIAAGFLVNASAQATFALGLLGIIVGLINITEEEVKKFLIATTALIIGASSLSAILARFPIGGDGLVAVLDNIVAFVAPAAGVVALKTVYDIVRSA